LGEATFEVALHSRYLCLKVPATFGVITVFDSQKEARSIECILAPGLQNVHFLREDADQHEQVQPLPKQDILAKFKKAIEAEGDFSRVALDPRIPDRTICISA
jgi:hypothetical protein